VVKYVRIKTSEDCFVTINIVRIFLIVIFASLLITGCDSDSDGGADGSNNNILYVAIGASDAVGIGAIPLTNGYVFRIRDRLEDESFNVDLRNLGIPAAETDIIREEVELFLSGIELGIVGDPDLVTMWLGANDIISGVDPMDFESELEALLQDLFDRTTAFIVIANIPDLTQLPRFVENPSNNVTIERVNSFNAIIEGLAQDFGIPVVDLFAEGIMDSQVSDVDGFHPSNEGHQRIAELFLDIILLQFN
jgi:lysophospholipase L1-like esterase